MNNNFKLHVNLLCLLFIGAVIIPDLSNNFLMQANSSPTACLTTYYQLCMCLKLHSVVVIKCLYIPLRSLRI